MRLMCYLHNNVKSFWVRAQVKKFRENMPEIMYVRYVYKTKQQQKKHTIKQRTEQQQQQPHKDT